jgi:hydroxyethylthiazole kinase-like uncharacterized protein yjeF
MNGSCLTGRSHFLYMKVFSVEQIRAFDAFTIENEPIASIDLMERASTVFTHWFTTLFNNEDIPVTIFCGPGNNGGDGLAVARLLYDKFYPVKVVFCVIGKNTSTDFSINRERLPTVIQQNLVSLEKGDPFPSIPTNSIIIDGIFGSGLSRPVEGYWGDLIGHINNLSNKVVSIDIPSGMFADNHSTGNIIQADHTLSFELPKLGFFFSENSPYTGQWNFRSIGLSPSYLKSEPTNNFYTVPDDVRSLLKKPGKFDHKGTYGHALLIMGSFGKIGAATLAAKACLRTGCGLVTVHLPGCGYEIMQTSVPEIMVSIDSADHSFENAPEIAPFSSVGMGCGLGTAPATAKALHNIIKKSKHPILLDADALNILSEHKHWLKALPENSILTPHPGEFRRLFGDSANDFERNKLQRELAQKYKVIILLKGAHTCIADPKGNCYFNSTGNPGMATAGSGDVLSGMITSLLAQNYTPLSAAILGVYLHGLAGDLASEANGEESLIASDIIFAIGQAYKKLKN